MSEQWPKIDDYAEAFPKAAAAEAYAAWAHQLLAQLFTYQLPHSMNEGAFPIHNAAYIEIKEAAAFYRAKGLNNIDKKADAPSQSASASTA